MKSLPWTSIDSAASREALGLNIANGCPLVRPIVGTHVPKGSEQIGCCRMGNELAEFLKYLHIPEQLSSQVSNKSSPFRL